MMSQAGGMDVNSLMQKVRRLAMLDTTVFDEVRADASYTLPAAAVAVVSTLLFALGTWLWWIFEDGPDSGEFFLKSVIIGTIISLIVFGVAVGVTYVMLTQVFRARADMNELVRVMGFATLPLALGLLFFLPGGFGFGLSLLALAVTFGTLVIAVQSATDAPAGRALAATAVGFLVWIAILSLFGASADSTDIGYVPNIFLFAID
ncbi:MAG: YIP1 family protein [Dehalococcoidia bacterium]